MASQGLKVFSIISYYHLESWIIFFVQLYISALENSYYPKPAVTFFPKQTTLYYPSTLHAVKSYETPSNGYGQVAGPTRHYKPSHYSHPIVYQYSSLGSKVLYNLNSDNRAAVASHKSQVEDVTASVEQVSAEEEKLIGQVDNAVDIDVESATESVENSQETTDFTFVRLADEVEQITEATVEEENQTDSLTTVEIVENEAITIETTSDEMTTLSPDDSDDKSVTVGVVNSTTPSPTTDSIDEKESATTTTTTTATPVYLTRPPLPYLKRMPVSYRRSHPKTRYLVTKAPSPYGYQRHSVYKPSNGYPNRSNYHYPSY